MKLLPNFATPSPRKRICIFLSIFLFFFLISLCAPYSYDDYEFAVVSMLPMDEIMNFSLTYGNGRLLGNWGVIMLLKSPIFAALAKASVFSLMVFLIPGILGMHKPFALFVSFLLVTGIDSDLFAQAVTWTSGFQNYVPPVFLMLVMIYLIQKYPSASGYFGKKLLICVSVFLLALAGQLYVEPSSLINLAVAIVLLVKIWHDPKHQGQLPALLFLLGAGIGLLLMFWIPGAFHIEGNHTDGYRTLYLDSFRSLLFCCARNFLKVTNHFFGLLGLPVCGGAAITVHMTRHRRSEMRNRILYSLSFFCGGSMGLFALMGFDGWYGETSIVYHIFAMVVVLTALAVWVIALFRLEDTLLRDRTLLLLCGGIFSLLPLLIVTPIHIRTVYHAQIFTVMAFALCLNRFSDNWKQSAVKWVTVITKGIALLLAIAMLFTFFSIGSMAQARHRYVLQQLDAGAEQIDFFRIPSAYVHEQTDPNMGLYYYRSAPNDTLFHIQPYDVWTNDHLDQIQ